MHANVQTRFNPATGEKALYYRLKESYRDVAGHVHSLILLNIGFDPSLTALQVRRIAFALTERFKNRGTNSLFCKHLEGLTELEQAKADEWWQRMKEEGAIITTYESVLFELLKEAGTEKSKKIQRLIK